ncbi:MAG: pilus assembly protein [Syntrophobacteraceae bacterium]
MKKTALVCVLLGLIFLIPTQELANSNECTAPPFVTTGASPLVMMVLERDHRLYYEAYNDASDLDEDGKLDIGYKHSIDYSGYFDSSKCYEYDYSTSTYNPIRMANNKYCGGGSGTCSGSGVCGDWSGNFLNWLSMSRMDVLRKVLYGGHRSTDTASTTVLEGVYIPQDAHSWGKEYKASDTRDLTPFTQPASGQHLFCMTSTSEGQPHKIRVDKSDAGRVWDWASKERPVCNDRTGVLDFTVRVKVCDETNGTDWLEGNCSKYGGAGGDYKPTGILQKYAQGNGKKICSKSWVTCDTAPDNYSCTAADGVCIDGSQLYIGLISGSYANNLDGGVLRKNLGAMTDEINLSTGVFTAPSAGQGGIISTIDGMKTVGFDYGSHSYSYGSDGDSGYCNWITTRPIRNHECLMWGNPIGEMMYEALRYLGGKTTATSDFTYGTDADPEDALNWNLSLPRPRWGVYGAGNTPYGVFPECSKPFMLVISDVNTNFDSDKIPGNHIFTSPTTGTAFTGDTSLTHLNAETLANIIGSNETVAGGTWFIGQSASNDFTCTAKSVTNLGSIRGLCPEEPTKQGSFYPASAAFYGKILAHQDIASLPDVTTMAVALSSSVPDINIKVGNQNVRIVPTGKSVSGCYSLTTNCYNRCPGVEADTSSGGRGLQLSKNGPCADNAYCPSNQIVDFYVENITYDANNNVTDATFRINFEDVEQGADHDMDAIVYYKVEAVSGTQIRISVYSYSAAGCIDQVLGFAVSGTTEDGLYLPIRDSDSDSAPGEVLELPKGTAASPWSKTFTVSGSAAGILKDPLWYAAKYGSFTDVNGNSVPDLKGEWDKSGEGTPDNYFYVTNPLHLYEQLDRAFSSIMGRVGSAGAVATVTQQVMGQDIIVRGAFTSYEGDPSSLVWKGHLEAYWPYAGCATYQSETSCRAVSGCSWLDAAPVVTPTPPDPAPSPASPSCAPACSDISTQGACTARPGCLWQSGQCTATASLFSSCTEKMAESLCISDTSCAWKTTDRCTGLNYSFQKPENAAKFCYEHHDHCWEAEELMPTPNSRSIFTLLRGTQKSFTSTNICSEADTLGLTGDGEFALTDCGDLVNWVRGSDSWTKGRDRSSWVLGDIVYSTPVVVQAPSLASLPPDAAAATCTGECATSCAPNTDCARECFYCYREVQKYRKKMIYVGANDGMLHAFVAGIWWQDSTPEYDSDGDGTKDESHWIYDPNEPDSSCEGLTCSGKELIGTESWAYIPSNLLTKLKELARPTYGTDSCQHRFMVDLSPQAWDVFIDPDGVGSEPKQWRTVLIGGQREGGDVYFALDVTDPNNPKVLWEFPTLRNMARVFDYGAGFQAELPYSGKTIYESVKALPSTWSVPYVGQLKIPAGVEFLAADPIPTWAPGNPTPDLKKRGGPDSTSLNKLSGWFAVIGGGPRLFKLDDLPASLTLEQKLAALKPNLLMIDIEKGVNIFQYHWPLLQSLIPTRWPEQQTSVGSYVPYSMTNPLVLDIWDSNGSIGNDGFLDHIYLGDLNGYYYGLKFNMDTGSTKGLELDIWQTKPIASANVNDNIYRSDTQPISVLTSAAYDPQHNLRLYLGTGKYDNIDKDKAQSDKTDKATMSFYSKTEDTVRPTIEPGGIVTQVSDSPTLFSASANAKGETSTGYTMNNLGMEVHFHCDSTTYLTGCTWVKSDKTPDTCTNSSTPCWSCVYDLTHPGERVVDSALVAGGLVFFTTFVPTTDPCASGGYSYLYVLDYMCGIVDPNPLRNAGFKDKGAFSSVTQTGDFGKISQGTQTAGYGAMLGPGMPSRPVLDSSGEYIFVQTSDGVIHRIKVDLPMKPMELKGWKEE